MHLKKNWTLNFDKYILFLRAKMQKYLHVVFGNDMTAQHVGPTQEARR